MKAYYVYLMTNHSRTVLYTGVTSDLRRRVYEHREKLADGFASRYNATRLVWFEQGEDPLAAITREKQIKAGSRARKLALIEAMNPEWRELGETLG